MDEAARARHLAFIYDGLAVLFCMILSTASTVLFGYLRTGFERDIERHEAFYVPFVIGACIIFTTAANLYIKYFGVPKSLTFGYQIGKILPPTCEASMPIEGKNGLPCSLKRFWEWFGRVTSGDGSLHLDELEGDWKVLMIYAGLLILVIVAVLKVVSCIKADERKKRAVAQAVADEMECLRCDDDG